MTNPYDLLAALESCGWRPTVVLCGLAKGADNLGHIWALKEGIPVETYPADWNTYGRGAGFKRNLDMGNKAEALIALWDGESKGTKHMIDIASKLELKIHIQLVG